MTLKVYAYTNCGTCRKAKKFLDLEGIEFDEIPIRDHPPTKSELRRMLGYMDGKIRKLFNTSGGDYKALGMKDKLPGMSDKEAIDLLASNGNLVKRPFAQSTTSGTVGFDEDTWRELFGQ